MSCCVLLEMALFCVHEYVMDPSRTQEQREPRQCLIVTQYKQVNTHITPSMRYYMCIRKKTILYIFKDQWLLHKNSIVATCILHIQNSTILIQTKECILEWEQIHVHSDIITYTPNHSFWYVLKYGPNWLNNDLPLEYILSQLMLLVTI